MQKESSMRYMMLIYSKEQPGGPDPDTQERIYQGHVALIEEAAKGILVAAEPLAPTSTATTVRVDNGKALITDGPFAETKEQLAGYYVLDCANLDEAIDWAARIPTGCKGAEGCVEIRPMPGIRLPSETEAVAEHAIARNG
jgi:hypothetical protein